MVLVSFRAFLNSDLGILLLSGVKNGGGSLVLFSSFLILSSHSNLGHGVSCRYVGIPYDLGRITTLFKYSFIVEEFVW